MITLSPEEFWAREGGSKGEPLFSGLDEIRSIILDVARRGDEALIDYSLRFDGVRLSRGNLVLPEGETDRAWERVGEGMRSALRAAYERILAFHRNEVPRSWVAPQSDGTVLGKIYKPIERVGVYVPGGKASYPSSVLMTCIPARVAGVKEMTICTPPGRDGRVDDVVLAAARLVDVSRVIRVGGPQAIAAMAFGTESVPKVDKIVGPGGYYVTQAKRALFGMVGIDMLAGPSEVAILADDTANFEFLALDMISQAEHDPMARAILVTPDEGVIQGCKGSISRRIEEIPRAFIVRESLEKNGSFVRVRDLEEGVDFINALAPEHLSIQTRHPMELLGRIKASGSILLGPFSPVALSDYILGPNHVLPTGQSARFSSALGVETFLVGMSFAACSREAFKEIASFGVRLAEAEGLYNHALALKERLGGEAREER